MNIKSIYRRVWSFSSSAMLVGMLAGNVCQAGDWTHEASVSITGKSGNTEKNDYSVRAKSVWEEDAERLELTASYQYGESTIRLRDPETGEELGSLTEKSSDELIGGAHYTHMFQETLGWYARDEIEQDSFESIDLRNTAAAGLTWVAVDSLTTRFELSAGVSHRYESYDIGGSESLMGLDLGIKHKWEFASWGVANTTISYTPAFEDFDNYRISHTTDVDIPLGTSDMWKLRVSVMNQYNSKPIGYQDELDTTWVLGLLLSWK